MIAVDMLLCYWFCDRVYRLNLTCRLCSVSLPTKYDTETIRFDLVLSVLTTFSCFGFNYCYKSLVLMIFFPNSTLLTSFVVTKHDDLHFDWACTDSCRSHGFVMSFQMVLSCNVVCQQRKTNLGFASRWIDHTYMGFKF